MGSPGGQRLTLVFAPWCPHCVPISTEAAPRLARQWGAELRLLDIDRPKEEAIADALVEAHGDWDPNYLIPQVFWEAGGGRVVHLLTGDPGSLDGTRRRWERLLAQRSPPA